MGACKFVQLFSKNLQMPLKFLLAAGDKFLGSDAGGAGTGSGDVQTGQTEEGSVWPSGGEEERHLHRRHEHARQGAVRSSASY